MTNTETHKKQKDRQTKAKHTRQTQIDRKTKSLTHTTKECRIANTYSTEMLFNILMLE
jgi:hypothetical protein